MLSYYIRIWSPVSALIAYKVNYYIDLIFLVLLNFDLKTRIVYVCKHPNMTFQYAYTLYKDCIMQINISIAHQFIAFMMGMLKSSLVNLKYQNYKEEGGISTEGG